MSVVIITNNKNEAFSLKYVYIIHKDQNNAYVFNVCRYPSSLDKEMNKYC